MSLAENQAGKNTILAGPRHGTYAIACSCSCVMKPDIKQQQLLMQRRLSDCAIASKQLSPL